MTRKLMPEPWKIALPSVAGLTGAFVIGASRGILPSSPLGLISLAIGQLSMWIALPLLVCFFVHDPRRRLLATWGFTALFLAGHTLLPIQNFSPTSGWRY
jgi:hypothetical protein